MCWIKFKITQHGKRLSTDANVEITERFELPDKEFKRVIIKMLQQPIMCNLGTYKWKWSRSVMSDPFDPMDCSLPGSSVHGIFQARILEWVSISFSRGSSQPRDWTQVSRIVGRCFTVWESRSIQKLNSSIFARKSGLCFLYLSFCPWWFKVTARIWRIDNNVVD